MQQSHVLVRTHAKTVTVQEGPTRLPSCTCKQKHSRTELTEYNRNESKSAQGGVRSKPMAVNLLGQPHRT